MISQRGQKNISLEIGVVAVVNILDGLKNLFENLGKVGDTLNSIQKAQGQVSGELGRLQSIQSQVAKLKKFYASYIDSASMKIINSRNELMPKIDSLGIKIRKMKAELLEAQGIVEVERDYHLVDDEKKRYEYLKNLREKGIDLATISQTLILLNRDLMAKKTEHDKLNTAYTSQLNMAQAQINSLIPQIKDISVFTNVETAIQKVNNNILALQNYILKYELVRLQIQTAPAEVLERITRPFDYKARLDQLTSNTSLYNDLVNKVSLENQNWDLIQAIIKIYSTEATQRYHDIEQTRAYIAQLTNDAINKYGQDDFTKWYSYVVTNKQLASNLDRTLLDYIIYPKRLGDIIAQTQASHPDDGNVKNYCRYIAQRQAMQQMIYDNDLNYKVYEQAINYKRGILNRPPPTVQDVMNAENTYNDLNNKLIASQKIADTYPSQIEDNQKQYDTMKEDFSKWDTLYAGIRGEVQYPPLEIRDISGSPVFEVPAPEVAPEVTPSAQPTGKIPDWIWPAMIATILTIL